MIKYIFQSIYYSIGTAAYVPENLESQQHGLGVSCIQCCQSLALYTTLSKLVLFNATPIKSGSFIQPITTTSIQRTIIYNQFHVLVRHNQSYKTQGELFSHTRIYIENIFTLLLVQ